MARTVVGNSSASYSLWSVLTNMNNFDKKLAEAREEIKDDPAHGSKVRYRVFKEFLEELADGKHGLAEAIDNARRVLAL